MMELKKNQFKKKTTKKTRVNWGSPDELMIYVMRSGKNRRKKRKK